MSNLEPRNHELARLTARPIQMRGSRLAQGLLRLFGWRVQFDGLPARQGVLIVYPHTSNWDFPFGLGAKWALSLDAAFLGKHTLFRFPFGVFLRYLGGIPVNRRAPQGVAETVIARYRESERLYVVIAPEGTRRKVARWKSGFHRIAREANVPVVPVLFDWSRRLIRVDPPVEMSADLDADVARLQARAEPSMARRPEMFWGA